MNTENTATVDNAQFAIRIFAEVADGEIVHNVDARELHKGLKVGKEFAHWIKNRITDYSFEEGKDYLPNLANRSDGLPGRGRKEYKLSIDMAKELCMLERSEMGSKCRKYFIECEKNFHIAAKQLASGNIEAEKELIESMRVFRDELKDMRSQLNTRSFAPADLETPCTVPEDTAPIPRLIREAHASKILCMSCETLKSWRKHGKDFPFSIYTSQFGYSLYNEIEIGAYIQNGMKPAAKYGRYPTAPAPKPVNFKEEETEALFTMTDVGVLLGINPTRLPLMLYSYGVLEKKGSSWYPTQKAIAEFGNIAKMEKNFTVDGRGKHAISAKIRWTKQGIEMCRHFLEDWKCNKSVR